MTDITSLPFRHADGAGILVLSDDGTVRVEPGEALRDALAGREEQALATAQAVTRLGLGLIGLGLAAVGAGWYVGRVGGKHAWRQTAPRSVRVVEIAPAEGGGLRARLGKSVWDITGYEPSDAETFLAALKEMKNEHE